MRSPVRATDESTPTRSLPPDLSDPKTVARLSVEAVRLVDQIADAWRLTLDQRCSLLGGINPSTYTRRAKNPDSCRPAMTAHRSSKPSPALTLTGWAPPTNSTP